MAKVLLFILFLGLTAGCSAALKTAPNGDSGFERSSTADAPPTASSVSPGEYACEPAATPGSLEADATLADRAGRYHLILVADSVADSGKVAESSKVADSNSAEADSAGTSRRAVSGLLVLQQKTRDVGSSDPSSGSSTPLFGFTDVDPESVGAHRVGDPGSRDPSAPGVLVIERSEYGRGVITLRLGSDANRRDLVRYEGTYTTLSVNRIDEGGFSGSWRSGGGMGFTVTTGYFCAWKVP
ncbi:MAG: hypothetical protein OXH02_05605 [Gemmatimonadetes bacterium]|nr:hypothetical protein [Gemmatimonadota bacterium]